MWKYKFNEKTGKNEFNSRTYQMEVKSMERSQERPLKRATGTSDPAVGERILKKVAHGMAAEEHDTQIERGICYAPCFTTK